jgi:hypothetical protein
MVGLVPVHDSQLVQFGAGELCLEIGCRPARLEGVMTSKLVKRFPHNKSAETASSRIQIKILGTTFQRVLVEVEPAGTREDPGRCPVQQRLQSLEQGFRQRLKLDGASQQVGDGSHGNGEPQQPASQAIALLVPVEKGGPPCRLAPVFDLVEPEGGSKAGLRFQHKGRLTLLPLQTPMSKGESDQKTVEGSHQHSSPKPP